MYKTWGRIRSVFKPIRIRFGIRMEIRIRIGITTMPIHHTDKYKEDLIFTSSVLFVWKLNFAGIQYGESLLRRTDQLTSTRRASDCANLSSSCKFWAFVSVDTSLLGLCKPLQQLQVLSICERRHVAPRTVQTSLAVASSEYLWALFDRHLFFVERLPGGGYSRT